MQDLNMSKTQFPNQSSRIRYSLGPDLIAHLALKWVHGSNKEAFCSRLCTVVLDPCSCLLAVSVYVELKRLPTDARLNMALFSSWPSYSTAGSAYPTTTLVVADS